MITSTAEKKLIAKWEKHLRAEYPSLAVIEEAPPESPGMVFGALAIPVLSSSKTGKDLSKAMKSLLAQREFQEAGRICFIRQGGLLVAPFEDLHMVRLVAFREVA